ncbi:hypothetical protein NLG97_g3461 [Lecanicillium saksenae]|uniref:Uncharacterized protein n=1 Tax=Lecanicillium saksenae TaxID=468837 RepID=A0ACC1R0P7_9HYPO|nr:hypothetical protein NLG97_g3461 [Lecanicillium saksenae]
MKSILVSIFASAALVACAPQSNIMPSPASTTLAPVPAATSAVGGDGGHAEGWGPDGDIYDDHGPFPTAHTKMALGEGGHAEGWGPEGDFYDVHVAFPKASATTGSLAGSEEQTSAST